MGLRQSWQPVLDAAVECAVPSGQGKMPWPFYVCGRQNEAGMRYIVLYAQTTNDQVIGYVA